MKGVRVKPKSRLTKPRERTRSDTPGPVQIAFNSCPESETPTATSSEGAEDSGESSIQMIFPVNAHDSNQSVQDSVNTTMHRSRTNTADCLKSSLPATFPLVLSNASVNFWFSFCKDLSLTPLDTHSLYTAPVSSTRTRN